MVLKIGNAHLQRCVLLAHLALELDLMPCNQAHLLHLRLVAANDFLRCNVQHLHKVLVHGVELGQRDVLGATGSRRAAAARCRCALWLRPVAGECLWALRLR